MADNTQVPNEPTKQGPSVWDHELSERGIGVLTLCFGCGCAYMSFVSPILAAMRHEERLSAPKEGIFITPLVLALGVVYTILGDSTAKYLGPPQSPSLGGVIFYVVFAGIGVGGYFWLKAVLKGLGYET